MLTIKNNRYMELLKILTCIILLAISGCQTNRTDISTDLIVTKYVDTYIKVSAIDTNTDNHDIAAMLQTFTVDLIHVPLTSWKDVQTREDQYISTVSTGMISNVYTIIASSNEIKIVDGFCDDILCYYSVIEPDYATLAGNFLSESAIRFIVTIDKYQYEKEKNNISDR